MAKDNINFKFALDKQILMQMNGKAYGRQAAGKFITIYPFTEEHFKELIEAVHAVTKQYDGLYILSDKRYKDSKVVFYRYGGILPMSSINIRGGKSSKIFTPDGKEVDDLRVPYFNVPEWTTDPFPDEPQDTVEEKKTAETPETAETVEKKETAAAGEKTGSGETAEETIEAPEEITLKDGRYLVKYPLGYSNSGGIYIAEDRETGAEVVIKESRPYISTIRNSTQSSGKRIQDPEQDGGHRFCSPAGRFFQGLGTLLSGNGKASGNVTGKLFGRK